jgi:subtilisin-like proprotein convertase family protein
MQLAANQMYNILNVLHKTINSLQQQAKQCTQTVADKAQIKHIDAVES